MLARGNENFRAPGENRTRDLPNPIIPGKQTGRSWREFSGTAEGEGLVGLQPYHFYCWDLFSRAPVDMEKYGFHYLKVIKGVYCTLAYSRYIKASVRPLHRRSYRMRDTDEPDQGDLPTCLHTCKHFCEVCSLTVLTQTLFYFSSFLRSECQEGSRASSEVCQGKYFCLLTRQAKKLNSFIKNFRSSITAIENPGTNY